MNSLSDMSSARSIRLRGVVACVWRLCLAIGACATVASGQYVPFQFEHFGADDGLSNQVVTCVLRDRAGFLWAGTENGLNRYDGYRFKHFLAAPDVPGSLRDNTISTLFEDSRGHLWVGTKAGGLHLFDPRTETFRVFQREQSGQGGVSDNRIYRLFEDAAGNLWIGTAGGLDKLVWSGGAPESIQITSFRSDPANPESLSHDRVTSMAEDSSGTLWVGTRAGLNRLVSETPPRFVRYMHDPAAPTGLHDDEIYSLLVDSADALWIGAWGGGGLARLTAAERAKPSPVFARFPENPGAGTGFPDDIVVDMFEDRAGNVWFCTGDHGRLARLAAADRDMSDPAFLVFDRDEGNPYSLSAGSTVDAFEDFQGIIWIATLEGGLNKLDPRKSLFGIHRNNPGAPSLPSSVITTVVEDADGSLWTGSDDGLTQVVPAARPFGQPRYTTWRADPSNPAALRSNGISSLLVDSKGRLWVGTINGGLSLRESRGGRTAFSTYVRDPAKAGSLGNNAVLTLFEDSRGHIWVGTYNGLYRVLGPAPGSRELAFVSYRSVTNAGSLSSDQIEALSEGPDGAIWVGTASGLNRLDPDSGAVARFLPDPDDPESLCHEFVEHLVSSPRSNSLWIATRGGLCRLDFGTETIARVDATTGLDRLSVQSLVEDERGYVWAGTINGLFRLDPVTGVVVAFGKGDGLASEIFNRGAARRGSNGRLYFGSTAGLIVVQADAVETNAFQPPVVLTELLLANRVQPIRAGSVLPARIQFLDELVLKHTDNIFTIEFSALDFTRPGANRYAYKLESLYDEWIETDSENRRATFTNLPAGEYVFRVKAANNHGVWNESGPALKVVVLPPWWKTWWAQALFYSAAILALLAIPFLRLSSLKRQRGRLETQVAQRTAELLETNERLVEASRAKSLFLSNMSHELRTPLNAVIGFSQLMERDEQLTGEQRESLGLIQRAGEHLLGLINDVLSISKIEAGKLMLVDQVFDPHKMLRAVEEMVRVRAEAKDLRLIFDVSATLPRAVRGDEGKLRQVLINLLGNAIKFTEQGGVALRCTWNGADRARFEIEDTGVGISAEEVGTLFEAFVQTHSGRTAKEGTGLGLVISQQIVRLMGGEISVRSQIGTGTVFAFDAVLPPSTDEAGAPAERRQIVSLALDQPVPRVLVVDDTHENRLLLSKLLASIGVVTREAANGQEAVEQWESWRPDLIFMDLRMPVMDGYEATREIRRRERESENARPCKIVAVTASAFEHERGIIIERGADDFVSKPFREETIFEKLASHLDVRYRYKDSDAALAESGDDRLPSAAQLATLSKEQIHALYDALANGDRHVASQVARQVEGTDERLAQALLAAIKAYRLDELMTVIESLQNETL